MQTSAIGPGTAHGEGGLERPSPAGPSGPGRALAAGVLLVVLAAFVALRLPPILHQSGGSDEEWFAVPGLTVAREGVPRIPYSRATEAGSMFLGAEKLLFAMPPLSFYAQAPFFLVLPPTYATARLASLAAGCVAILLAYAIARSLGFGRAEGLWAAGIFAACRLLYFPAMLARPDMLCGTLGLAAAWSMCRWARGRRRRWLGSAGIFLGLAGLTHPFALMIAVQMGLWAVLARGSLRDRAARGAGLAAATLAAFSPWLILIAREPGLFRAQFFANVLDPAGPGLAARLLFPWPEMAEHLPLVVERAGPGQAAFLAACSLAVAGLAWRRRDRALALLPALGISAVYLLIALQGRHPLQGYWCYPAVSFAIAAGWCVARGFEACRERWGAATASALSACLMMAVFLPGGGLKATWACLRHRDRVDYNPREFTRSILAGLPADARLTVGVEYAMDAYGLDRRVLLGIVNPNYYDASRFEYDYAILGRVGLKDGVDRALGGQIVQTFGDESDPFACYAVLLAPVGRAATAGEGAAP